MRKKKRIEKKLNSIYPPLTDQSNKIIPERIRWERTVLVNGRKVKVKNNQNLLSLNEVGKVDRQGRLWCKGAEDGEGSSYQVAEEHNVFAILVTTSNFEKILTQLAFQEILMRLNLKERKLITLRARGARFRKIGKTMGRSEATVNRWYNKLVQKIRRMLREKIEDFNFLKLLLLHYLIKRYGEGVNLRKKFKQIWPHSPEARDEEKWRDLLENYQKLKFSIC